MAETLNIFAYYSSPFSCRNPSLQSIHTLALIPIQASIQRFHGFTQKKEKQPEREANHLLPSNVKIANEWKYTFTLTCFYDMHVDNFNLSYIKYLVPFLFTGG